jgi:glycerol-3-phosphate dehydrogenase
MSSPDAVSNSTDQAQQAGDNGMLHTSVKRAAVIGGGSFGTAMGLVLARKGADVHIWVRNSAQAKAVNDARCNERYLPGVEIPENMVWTDDVAEAVEGAEIILLAIPTQFLRPFLETHRSTFPTEVPLVLAAKGIEVGSLQTPFEIMEDELPGKYRKMMCVLSGPSFAKEIAARMHTAVAVAARDPEVADRVQRQMSSPEAAFRCYRQDDITGCEIAGAMKNVLAIASGAATGLGLANNSRAGLVCRGLSEIGTLAKARGSNGAALPGLAGVGDLSLTCSSELSRNFTVGKRLAGGETLDDIIKSTNSVAEGVATAKALKQLTDKMGLHLPVCNEVYLVLYEDKKVPVALKDLFNRPLTAESLM